MCVLGGGGAPARLLAAESLLPAGPWGQRVAGDRPGGMEPKTLEMASGNPCLVLVGKPRPSEGKVPPHAFLEQTSRRAPSLVVCRHAGLSCGPHGVLLPSRVVWVCLCPCVYAHTFTRVPVRGSLEHSGEQVFSIYLCVHVGACVCVCVCVSVGFSRSPVPSSRDPQGLSSTTHSPCLLGPGGAYPGPNRRPLPGDLQPGWAGACNRQLISWQVTLLNLT